MPQPPVGSPVPFARHANPVTQAGFTQIPNAVMLRKDIKPLTKLVYGYLKHLAWRNSTDVTDPPQASIAADLGVTENAVREALRELARVHLIEPVRRGQGLPNVYLIYDAVEVDDEGIPTARTSDSGVLELAVAEYPARARSLSRTTKTEKQDDRPPDRPVAVDRKPVTDREYETAQEILQIFNQIAGTAYRGKQALTMIIMRIREVPELTVEAHEAVIKRAFADPWWRGSPSPAVVYSPNVFQKAIHDVRVEPRGGAMTPEEMERYAVDDRGPDV